ncbi:NDP-hexose 2,3-dehydratase family protein [Sphaerisporangium sp. NBC_01403]|uniref:NDP-hexose 2,3-dehydratase family protein n=1 Tax=Sphaerisporangium TaxID=321315 RepID=UPI0032545C22
MTVQTLLAAREDLALPGRLARSIAVRDAGAQMRTADFDAWLRDRARAHPFIVERIPLADLEGWSFDPHTGDLRHHSGRFFSVDGLDVTVGEPGAPPIASWQQPIIVQPEVGILGILCREIDGVLHLLMQAKMEPGNPGLLQLSPTVQATHSNYSRVHKGAAVRYLEYFLEPGRGRVLADVLQSEHGSWFLQKRNRNMVIEVDEDVPLAEDFCWLTLGQIGELLKRDNVVNMDSRTVIACIPAADAESGAWHSDTDLLSWFNAQRSRYRLTSRRMPLAQVSDWGRDEYSIHHVHGRYFKVVAMAVGASNREVAGWTQPLFEPVRPGLTAFVMRRFGGVPHLLAHARIEGGFLDTVELGPTVQCTPEYYTDLPPERRPAYLDLVMRAGPADILYDAVHAEEGGRFLNAVNRYLVVEAGEHTAPTTPPRGFRWVTTPQLTSLVRHGHYVNVQARTLLAAITTRAVAL